MSYKTGSSSYLNVPFPQTVTTTNQIGSFSTVDVTNAVTTSNDNAADIGRATKRFRKAFIQEMDTDATGILNGLSITTYDDGVNDRSKGTIQTINPIVVGPSETTNGQDGLTASIINPTTRIMVAIGSTNSGNDFRAFSSTSSIDTSDTVWTKRTINLTNMPTGAAIYNPRFLVYDSVNDSYLAFNGYATTSYYYCPGSNLDGWETRTSLPFMFVTGATTFVFNSLCYTFVVNAATTMFYSTDNVVWTQLTNFVNKTGTTVSILTNVYDMLERPDWQDGEFDRYILLTATSAGQSFTLWTSTNPTGPFTSMYTVNGSANLRTLLYNPYYKTLLLTKTATSHVSIYQYFPNQIKTPVVLSGTSQYNLALTPTFFALQNDSYFPDFKTHIFSMSAGSGNPFGLGVYLWDGQLNVSIANGANTATSANYVAGHNKWTLDLLNGVAYAAVRKGSTSSVPPTTSNFTISKMNFMFPSPSLSNPSSAVPRVTNANKERVMVTSKRAMIDKFDRFVSMTSDKITGGIGSSQGPVKSVIFNNSVRSMGRDAYLYTKSANQDTVIANVNFENMLSNPSVLAKSIVSSGNMKNKDWTGTASSVAAFTVNQSFNTRFIGSSSSSFAGISPRTFAISNSTGALEIISSIDGGASWQPFSTIPTEAFKTATIKEGSDIAYSPIYNTYVVTAIHTGNNNGFQIGDRGTFYSNDGGATWNYCKFDIWIDLNSCFGMVKWVADWGSHGMFVLLEGISASGSLACVMLSEDGISWRNVNNLPSSLPTLSSLIRQFTKYDYDASRNMMAVSRLITSSTSNNFTYTSTDGENWNAMDNLQTINIYAKDIVLSSTVTVPNTNVNFKVNTSGSEFTATLTSGTYTPGALAAHIAAQMTTAIGGFPTFFTGTYSQSTGKFNFKIICDLVLSPTGPTSFQFLFSTGTNASTSPRVELGFNTVDTSLAETQLSTTIQYFHPTLNNNRVDFLRNGTGTNRVGYLRPGNYTPATFATEFSRAINVQWVGAGLTAVTTGWSSVTGFFTLSTAQSIDVLWLTGANNTINCYREFGVAKVDVVGTTSMVSTVAQHHDGGVLRSIAYSPTLDIWVQVGTPTGAGTTGPASSNVWWSKEIGPTASSYNYGWTPVDCFQQGIATLRPFFNDITWCDSMQMFLLLNANANYAGNVANDRNLWYSTDGKTFSPITNVNSPKTVLTTVNALSQNRLVWDNANHSLFIDTPSANLATTITRYSFGALQRNEIPHMPGMQYATATASSNNPAAGGVATWTFTFPQPFTVAPAFIIYSFSNTPTNAFGSFTSWISATTTTTFTITAVGSAGATATNPPVIRYIAWENF